MRASAPGQLQSFTGTARRTLKRRLRPESGLLPSEYKRHVIGLTWPSLPAVEAVRQCPVLNGLNSSVNPRHARAIAGSRAYAHPAFATPSRRTYTSPRFPLAERLRGLPATRSTFDCQRKNPSGARRQR